MGEVRIRKITRKSDIQPILADLRAQCSPTDAHALADWLAENLLVHHVKFPLLEFFADEMNGFVPRETQPDLVIALSGRDEHGSSVVIGAMLQQWLSDELSHAFALAHRAIVSGATWYHCDQIGERVFGHGLLTEYDRALPLLTKYLDDPDPWIQRAVGVAAHYATKKGLERVRIEAVLVVLLAKAHRRNVQVQRGIGWGMKTIARYHPGMMRTHLSKVPADAITAPVRRKIETGLAAAARRDSD